MMSRKRATAKSMMARKFFLEHSSTQVLARTFSSSSTQSFNEHTSKKKKKRKKRTPV